MSDIERKLDYLDDTKQVIKQAIEEKGQTITDDLTFREYAEKIINIKDGDIALFSTIEEMNNDPKAEEGKLATVYNKETLDYEGLFEYKNDVDNSNYVKLYGALKTDINQDIGVTEVINYNNCDKINLTELNKKVQSLLKSENLDKLSGLCVCYNIINNIPEYIEIYPRYNIFINPQPNYLCADINDGNPSIVSFYRLNFTNNTIEKLNLSSIVTDYKISEEKIINIYLCKTIRDYFAITFNSNKKPELLSFNLSASRINTTEEFDYINIGSAYINEPKYVFVDSQLSNVSSDDIANGKIVLGANGSIEGTFKPLDTSDATADSDDLIYPKTAYVNGKKIQGTIISNFEYKGTLSIKDPLINNTSTQIRSVINDKYALTTSGNNIYIYNIEDNKLKNILVSFTLSNIGGSGNIVDIDIADTPILNTNECYYIAVIADNNSYNMRVARVDLIKGTYKNCGGTTYSVGFDKVSGNQLKFFENSYNHFCCVRYHKYGYSNTLHLYTYTLNENTDALTGLAEQSWRNK